MLKKISIVALAGLISLPGLAMATEGNQVADLEKQMVEMNKMFNAKMQAMQDEIAALKAKDAATPATAGAATTPAPGDWANKISLGGQVRFRGYNIQNVWDFNDDTDSDNRDLFRLKGSLKATVKATDDVTAVVQVTNQNWGEGSSYNAAAPQAGDSAMDNNSSKVFLDNAYIEARNLFDLPVDMTFGRMNLFYGSGFVIGDGQSQFTSGSVYFDGVKLRFHLTDKMTLDGLYMKDQENNTQNDVIPGTDPLITTGGHGDDITLAGAYFTATGCPIVGQTELYILNRNDEGNYKNIWMFGGRVANKMDNGIDYSLEAALQKGDAGNGMTGDVQDQDAWATKLEAGYTFKNVSMTPRLHAGYAFMSGDDQDTDGDYEGWDGYYGGFPQFGDLLAWTYASFSGSISQADPSFGAQSTVFGEDVYSNLQIMTIGASANLMQKLSGSFSYSNLTFDEAKFGLDDDLGDYYQATLKYQYNKQLSFMLYGALLAPGDAFDELHNDNATEVYWETDFKF